LARSSLIRLTDTPDPFDEGTLRTSTLVLSAEQRSHIAKAAFELLAWVALPDAGYSG
jgi:hypothetical protein